MENIGGAVEAWGGVRVCELGGLSTPPQSRTSSKVISIKNEFIFFPDPPTLSFHCYLED